MPALFLYEPRMLMRTVVTNLLTEQYPHIQAHQTLPSLIESLHGSYSENKTLLIGIAGAGHAFFDLLRCIRRMKSLKVKILVWVPAEYPWMLPLLRAIHVQQVLVEEEIATLLPAAADNIVSARPRPARETGEVRRTRSITQTELDILLQFASGLSSREMAAQRNCSYKTIFSWKHNICEALALESHSDWLDVLFELSQLSSQYQVG
ncbi:MAG: helix-turn-helix transcriptional regulator [Scandinavium sp.]|uniref:helix-turn-helix transcriptional regulator n=1 Tax=Scandinavium sp. TaxID=2830653 RepID=UPI003F2F68C5